MSGAGPSWFRRPGDEQPGTLNAAYQLLDRAVVAGRAEDEALPGTSVARLLERVGSFAGALRGFALTPGDRVLLHLPDGEELAVALLGAARLGVVAVVVTPGTSAAGLAGALDATEPGVVVSDDDATVALALADAEHVPADVVVLGESTGASVSWDLVMKAGRTDPAGVTDLGPDDPAVIVWPNATIRTTGELATRLAALEAPYPLGVLLDAFRTF